MESLTLKGTPHSGPASSPRANFSSAACAAHYCLPVEDFDRRMNPRVHGVNPLEVRLYQFACGDRALAHQPRLLRGR